MLHCRTLSGRFNVTVTQDRSIEVYGHPSGIDYSLNDVIETSVGPRDRYDGIKSCFTYNPPGNSEPGYQIDRQVGPIIYVDMIFIYLSY